MIAFFASKMRQGQQNGRAPEGFALVIAISLMAFCLLIVVSMTLLVTVESSSAQIGLERIRAREAARLALYMALGDLQKHAGPDQRVTARAEILGATVVNEKRFWTGVWDTSNPAAPPRWLVSGDNPDPRITAPDSKALSPSYDYAGDGIFNSPFDAPATSASFQSSSDASIKFAWWIRDEGVKASLKPRSRILDSISAPGLQTYLDYSSDTVRNSNIIQDPAFDDLDLFDPNAPPQALSRITNQSQLDFLSPRNSLAPAGLLESQRIHAVNWKNRFVLSNTADGGLKKDLTFIKTLDPASITQASLSTLYNDPDGLITPDLANLLQFRGNPTDGGPGLVSGMLIPETDVAGIRAKTQHFSLAPVITEFQLSMGVAAQDGEVENKQITNSPVYFVHKLYIEIWNPYTIPFRIGDTEMLSQRGYSDLRFEIENLPSYTITNDSRDGTITGSLPDVSLRWSEYANAKTLDPGMVFFQSLPIDGMDSGEDRSTGVIQQPLNQMMPGSRNDNYTGTFTFSATDPVTIRLFAINADENEREIFKAELDGYSDFTIFYDKDNLYSKFKRLLNATDSTTASAMHHDSLETQGYAFAVRFKMLDEQGSSPIDRDISDWLSRHDVRNPSFSVDLSNWSIDQARTSDPPLPYDFTVNDSNTALGFFDPSESFDPYDFFHYNEGTGREDRIARFIDFPVGEIAELGIMRSLLFGNNPMNAVSNPSGGVLNHAYDRYFFSTLPPLSNWTGDTPLLNNRIIQYGVSTPLSDISTSRNLLIENGFNLNSTSQLAWEKVLAGNSFTGTQLQLKYEKGGSNKWFNVGSAVSNSHSNFPQTALFNQTEAPTNPRYAFVSRSADVDAYESQFRIDSTPLQNKLQHPAFIQPIRELTARNLILPDTPNQIGQLSGSIVASLKQFVADKGHPPLTMAQFLNEGILQRAIDNSPSINIREDGVDSIPQHSPASITQATLMNTLGQFGFVRSDTFSIRAYGETIDPVSGQKVASAQIEAEVQRLPDRHQNANFGRQFKVLQLRWLDSIE